MTVEEIVAYIGAAAWLPQIAQWLYKRFVVPRVTIVPNTSVEIGFTTYGPIFNLRLALSAEHNDVVIDGFELALSHEDGDKRTLRWAGLGEMFSEVTDLESNRKQIISRDQAPVALKVGTASLTEKFVRFQEPRYHENDRKLLAALVAHFNYLKQTNPNPAEFVPAALKSKEYLAVVDGRKKSFGWKPGKYAVVASLSSPNRVRLVNSTFSFTLTPVEVDQLARNLQTIDNELTNTINSNLPDFKPVPILWNWSYPPFNKT